ncbi:hypothetical protein [Bradyrhizobium sp. USDA 10063]
MAGFLQQGAQRCFRGRTAALNSGLSAFMLRRISFPRYTFWLFIAASNLKRRKCPHDLVRVSLGFGRFLLPVRFEFSQELSRIQCFRAPDLLSQPLQLGKLFE